MRCSVLTSGWAFHCWLALCSSNSYIMQNLCSPSNPQSARKHPGQQFIQFAPQAQTNSFISGFTTHPGSMLSHRILRKMD
ncbi:hypothetical protein B0H13DRAFT_188544 [Mycena leptocephala]|nr:hypothetical protein B0H13DRAFT_188544 [Mycena leptocephala]